MRAFIRNVRIHARFAWTVAFIISNSVLAQDSAKVSANKWLVAVSVGMPGDGQEVVPELLTVGVNFTHVSSSLVAPDFSIGTAPYLMSQGLLFMGARAGLAVPIRVSPYFLLLPSAGLSILAAAAAGGGGAAIGANGGFAAVMQGKDTLGSALRLGMTWHRFQDARRAVWLFEVGMVLPRR